MQKAKILIVDDDNEFLDELAELLQSSGYEPVTVGNAGAAVEAARQVKPECVLLDLKMPEKSGFQLASEFAYAPELTGIPIIAMSAFYKDTYKALLDMCGIRRCLTKPFQALDVIAEIEEVLSEPDSRGQSPTC